MTGDMRLAFSSMGGQEGRLPLHRKHLNDSEETKLTFSERLRCAMKNSG